MQANLYQVEYLGDFATLMAKLWMPTKAVAYFTKRDPLALQALDKMLLLSDSAKPKPRLAA